MIADLEKCLLQDNENLQFESEKEFIDPFPNNI
jgi:hypothetical protein